jgi:hypothetical protein
LTATKRTLAAATGLTHIITTDEAAARMSVTIIARSRSVHVIFGTSPPWPRKGTAARM